jgi:hypothetical protein
LKDFLLKCSDKVYGVLSGFDRMIFRGTLSHLMYENGMRSHLYQRGVFLKEFKDYARHISDDLKEKSEKYTLRNDRPFFRLNMQQMEKEKKARELAEQDNINKGLICSFSVQEPCWSYRVKGNRASEKLEIKAIKTKCLQVYHYWQHPLFGLIHGRIQTWYPFNIQIYINGKEYLKRQLSRERIPYQHDDNCITWVRDLDRANALGKQASQKDWSLPLIEVMKKLTPTHHEIFPMGWEYYWTLAQSEWASDVLFKQREDVEAMYPHLIHHSLRHFGSKDVLRFLGKKLTSQNKVHGGLSKEVTSSMKERPEGIRIKHSMGSNSVKLYDKAGTVLRVETTINRPGEFKVYRKSTSGERKWQPMRKSIYDTRRRSEISQGVNSRLLNALTKTDVDEKFIQLVLPYLNPVFEGKYRARGLDPIGKDRELLKAIAKGEYLIKGFCNRNIREQLFPKDDQRKASSRVSRLLRILKAQGVIVKIQKTRRYQVSAQGRKLISALTAMENTSISKLMAA